MRNAVSRPSSVSITLPHPAQHQVDSEHVSSSLQPDKCHQPDSDDGHETSSLGDLRSVYCVDVPASCDAHETSCARQVAPGFAAVCCRKYSDTQNASVSRSAAASSRLRAAFAASSASSWGAEKGALPLRRWLFTCARPSKAAFGALMYRIHHVTGCRLINS